MHWANLSAGFPEKVLLPSSVVAHVWPADDKVAVSSQVVEGNVDAGGRGPSYMRSPILHVANANWPLAYGLGHEALCAIWYADKGIPPAHRTAASEWES